jgi:ABC-type Mn2+/Zn2+ transport system permease subunit
MAVGVVALGFVKTNVDLFGLMFGNILTVSPADLAILVVTALAVLAVFGAWFRPLLLASVDEDGARTAGVNVAAKVTAALSFVAVRLLVLVLIALAVVVALKVVGILLVSALLILPGATARTLFDRWPGLLLGSIGAALVMVLGGLFLSVALNVASGAAIILLGALLFVAAFLLSGRQRD